MGKLRRLLKRVFQRHSNRKGYEVLVEPVEEEPVEAEPVRPVPSPYEGYGFDAWMNRREFGTMTGLDFEAWMDLHEHGPYREDVLQSWLDSREIRAGVEKIVVRLPMRRRM